MNKKYVSRPAVIKTEERIQLLRGWLAVSGYRIFNVNPDWAKSVEWDTIAVHRYEPMSPFWIYPKPSGYLVIRPWTATRHAKKIKDCIPSEYLSNFRIMASRPMIRTPEWSQWLSPACREEAEILRFPH